MYDLNDVEIKIPYFFGYKTVFFPFQNSPKYLDLS